MNDKPLGIFLRHERVLDIDSRFIPGLSTANLPWDWQSRVRYHVLIPESLLGDVYEVYHNCTHATAKIKLSFDSSKIIKYKLSMSRKPDTCYAVLPRSQNTLELYRSGISHGLWVFSRPVDTSNFSSIDPLKPYFSVQRKSLYEDEPCWDIHIEVIVPDCDPANSRKKATDVVKSLLIEYTQILHTQAAVVDSIIANLK